MTRAQFKIVIPTRFAATRLPAKPLADIEGMTMVERVWRQASHSTAEEIIVATDNQRIYQVAQGFGAQVELTSGAHQSGTDRVFEVVERNNWAAATIIVNLQSDEPLMPATVINQVAALLDRHPDVAAASLYAKISTLAELEDPSIVKVVTDDAGYALYFSRAQVPWTDAEQLPRYLPYYRHIGLYAYRAGVLARIVKYPQSTLEKLEKLEQLRILAMGERIILAETVAPVVGKVDTEEDLAITRRLVKSMSKREA